MTPKTALILVGHGSHISPNTGGIVWRYVDRLRQQNIADEITACFWKEQPSIREVLHTVAALDVTIIPVFTAQGYFTQTVIPAELGLDAPSDGRMIHYGKTPGEHPGLADILQKRVEDALQTYDLNLDQTTVAIVGHGTKRNKNSRNMTRQQVKALAEQRTVHEVIDAYLDDDPDIPSIYERATTPHIIVVPFFLAAGSHVSMDVPNALGLPQGKVQAQLQGKHIVYTDPIGTDDAICQIILDLAYEAAMPHSTPKPTESCWTGFPQVGHSKLIQQVMEQGEVIMGELRITPDCVQPINRQIDAVQMHEPATLRNHLRENPFRPMASSSDLPDDWFVPVMAKNEIPAIVDTIYPGSLPDYVQTNSLAQTLARQQGDFRKLEELAPGDAQQVEADVCSNCVKFPLWNGAQIEQKIACMEPCNLWMSEALRIVS